VILHLVDDALWRERERGGPLCPLSLADEGFVHCTGDHETLLAVANRFYGAHDGPLVALEIDEALLDVPVVWEPPAHPDGSPAEPGAPMFPHVYGPLDTRAVTGTRTLVRNADATFAGYEPPLDEPAAPVS
jgi:uncharacterized protein (DUF952 family)